MAALPKRVPKGGAWHWTGRGLILLVVVVGLWWVSTWGTSKQGLFADALIIAVAVAGVNLITGYTGQLTLGQSAFFAIGAYTSMLLTEGKIATPFLSDNAWSPGWTIPMAAIVCFVVGCIVGLPALRLKGIYLALTTLVFVEAVLSILRYEKWTGVTGGSAGIKGDKYTPPSWTGLDGRADLNTWFIYLGLGMLLLVSVLVSGLIRTRIGRSMVAIRDNETAAAVMGVNLARTKTITFGLSGAITGVAGSLFGLKLGLVEPAVPLFGLFGAITFLVAMMVGGPATIWGPVVGALFYVFVNDYAREVGEAPDDSLLLGWLVGPGSKFFGIGGIVFGILLILFARFVPIGAVGMFRQLRAKLVVVVPRPPVLPGTTPPASALPVDAPAPATVDDTGAPASG
jgi:branched-chain amino acid transport system permease protein